MCPWQIAAKVRPIKKKVEASTDDLREDYDPPLIRKGIRGKYADRYKAGVKLVMLAPDVAAAFPDAKAVNDALRLLLQLAKTSVTHSARSGRSLHKTNGLCKDNPPPGATDTNWIDDGSDDVYDGAGKPYGDYIGNVFDDF